MNKPKILLFDLETSPNLSYTWGRWEQDVIAFKKEWELLSVAYKWLGEKTVHCITRPDFKDKTDKSLVVALKKLLDEADIVIAHNGDEFDIKKANAKFIEHDLGPTTAFQKIDTKKIAKRYFKFNSNSLDDLGNLLGLGRKMKTGGFDLWLDCMAGKPEAWRKMAQYNKQDVLLLERVYLKLRPWMDNHPNVSFLKDEFPDGCPKCGYGNLRSSGFKYNLTGKYRQYRCSGCGGYCLGRTAEKVNKPEYK
jgi:hypothetical protein